MARIKEAVKIVGFNAKDATKAAAIMESLGGNLGKKETTKFHVQLREIYKNNWEQLRNFNSSLLPVSVKPQKTKINKGAGKGAGIT